MACGTNKKTDGVCGVRCGVCGKTAAACRYILNILFTILLALCFRSFVFEPFHVPSGSMRTTLLEGDYLFVAKYAYGYSKYSLPFHVPLIKGKIMKAQPKRGDVVVFVPDNMKVFYIKRLVGVPGDKIQVKSGVLYVNDVPVQRHFVGTFADIGPRGYVKQYIETMNNGISYYTLEESPNSSINNTQQYVVPEGKYFMMGDNRDNSRDSRFVTEIGYVPEENIVGRASIIAFSIDHNASWRHKIRWDRLFARINTGVKPALKISRVAGTND